MKILKKRNENTQNGNEKNFENRSPKILKMVN